MKRCLQRVSTGFLLTLASLSALPAGTTEKAANDKGRELFEDLCSSCHELARATSRQFATRTEWRQLVASMLVEGDAATDEEISLITDYLVRNFGGQIPDAAR